MWEELKIECCAVALTSPVIKKAWIIIKYKFKLKDASDCNS